MISIHSNFDTRTSHKNKPKRNLNNQQTKTMFAMAGKQNPWGTEVTGVKNGELENAKSIGTLCTGKHE